MRRGLIITLLAGATCTALAQSTSSPLAGFDSKPWLEDFHQILSEMSSHYANLEWAVTSRRMNLPRLRLNAETKLREATDEAEARRVLDKFLASFGDGHLEIQWPKAGAQNKAALDTPQSLCDRMGYSSHLHPGLDLSALPEFSVLDNPESDLFPGGILRLQDHAVIGILRIGLLSEHAYPEICKQAAYGRPCQKGGKSTLGGSDGAINRHYTQRRRLRLG